MSIFAEATNLGCENGPESEVSTTFGRLVVPYLFIVLPVTLSVVDADLPLLDSVQVQTEPD